MKKNVVLTFLMGTLILQNIEASPIPLRGVAWQWCYTLPELEFCLQSIDAMADAGYNCILPEFGPLPENAGVIAANRKRLSREKYRKILTKAKERNMTVIPLLNSLSHSDRSIAWPAKLGSGGGAEWGMDLGIEANYELLFKVIDELKEDFETVGLPMPYIHLGMDEASACLLANAEKYSKAVPELLESHILRVYEFCKSRNLRMILYHDMFMSSSDPLYDKQVQYIHADKCGSSVVRKNLPRDIILMYWDYEPHATYGVVDGLRNEGFEVWLMPWGVPGMKAMTKHAVETGIPAIIESTWMECSYSSDAPPHKNHMINLAWMLEALEETAMATTKPSLMNQEPGFDPAFRFICRYFPAPAEKTVWNSAEGAWWKGVERLNSRGMLKSGKPVLLGEWPATTDNFAKLKKPLRACLENGTEFPVHAVNALARQADQIVLYTSRFGKSTKCNGFGTEITVINGAITNKTTWGFGDSAIPETGFVLSAHGKAAAHINCLPLGAKVEIYDANNVKFSRDPSVSGAMEFSLPVNAQTDTVFFLWGTASSGELDGRVIGGVRLEYMNGESALSPLMYGRDFYAWNAPGFFWGKRDTHTLYYDWVRSAGRKDVTAFTAWSWKNPQPEQTVKKIVVTLNEDGKALGLIIAGWQLQ